MDETKRNEEVLKLSKAFIPIIPAKWGYVPEGKLLINDKDFDITLGDVYYEHPGYIIENAVKVKDWVFVVEKMTDQMRALLKSKTGMIDDGLWYISAFFGPSHCTFDKIPNDAKKRTDVLLNFVVTKILPILKPEIYSDKLKDYDGSSSDFQVSWKIVQS